MRKPRREYVYVMGSPTSPIVKIGRSNNPERRLAQVQESVDLPLQIIWRHPGGNEMEKGLHRHFAAERRHGEWFELGFSEAPERVAEVIAANSWGTESFTMWKPRSTDCTACGHRQGAHGENTLCNYFFGWGDDAQRCLCPGHTTARTTKRVPEPSAPGSLTELRTIGDTAVFSVTYGRAS